MQNCEQQFVWQRTNVMLQKYQYISISITISTEIVSKHLLLVYATQNRAFWTFWIKAWKFCLCRVKSIFFQSDQLWFHLSLPETLIITTLLWSKYRFSWHGNKRYILEDVLKFFE